MPMYPTHATVIGAYAINLGKGAAPGDADVLVRTYEGNGALGRDHDGQIRHRYFGAGRHMADKVCKNECSSSLVEHGMARRYEGLLGDGQPGVGAVGVRDPAVGAAEVVAHRTRALRWLSPEQVTIASSCGFNHLPRRAWTSFWQ